MQKQIEASEQQIIAIRNKNEEEVRVLTDEVGVLKKQVETIPFVDTSHPDKFRSTKVFDILPGYKIEKTVQYPDLAAFTINSLEKLQPMRLGVHQFSLISKFGCSDILKTGFETDRANTTVQMTINQLNKAERVAKVEFKWKKYENKDNALFYYCFKFYSKQGKQLGVIQNLSDKAFQQSIISDKYKFQEKKHDYFYLHEDEVIAGIKLGLR